MRNLHRLLTIDPPPDSLLRVFMAAWKGLEKPMEVEEQELAGFERSGFAVAEWNCFELYGRTVRYSFYTEYQDKGDRQA